MLFRQAKQNDLENIMKIIHQAQDSLKSQNIDQWQNNYPNNDVIKKDINSNQSYVLEQDNTIVATAMLSFEPEPTYAKIEGAWLTNNGYAVIHRIAVDSTKTKNGFAKTMLSNLENLCHAKNIKSIKIDTHPDNKNMKGFLEKSGFKYCGVIYLLDGNKRIAFEKQI